MNSLTLIITCGNWAWVGFEITTPRKFIPWEVGSVMDEWMRQWTLLYKRISRLILTAVEVVVHCKALRPDFEVPRLRQD